ncbi:MAG: type VII secretion protein EssA [Hespellia sp.]|nr:type VII secretion protein EssA [Hespellia sp.]
MSDININPSVLQERTDTYSSLTDINGANVFTDAYEEKVQKYEQESKQTYDTVQEEVFIADVADSGDTYEDVKSQLFTASQTQVVKETSASDSGDMSIAVPIIGIAVVMMIILLVRYVEKKRRKWTNDETDDYAYE